MPKSPQRKGRGGRQRVDLRRKLHAKYSELSLRTRTKWLEAPSLEAAGMTLEQYTAEVDAAVYRQFGLFFAAMAAGKPHVVYGYEVAEWVALPNPDPYARWILHTDNRLEPLPRDPS